MAKKEKFGKFVLLEELETSGIGTEYRAAKLSQTGLEKIVSVLRLNPTISANGDVAKSLMDQAKFAAQIQSPNIVKIYGIGKVETSYYISYEFIEGKSLKAIFNRCRSEGFPFSVDHTLLIASKICSALEYAHGRKAESGGRYFHGLVTPACVMVSYEGEVRVRGFGYWPGRVRDAGLPSEDSRYLAPEQAAGGMGDTRSDIYAVGAILFETLTGQPFQQDGRSGDVGQRVKQARLQSPTGDDDAIPKPIADILQKSLAHDGGARYAEVQEMRKAIDTLLFSGDFTPTTFNLAFFMHSLFREDIERESRALKEEKETSYFDFLTEDKKGTSSSGSFPIPSMPTPIPSTAAAPSPVAAKPPESAPSRPLPREEPHPPHREPPHAEPAHSSHAPSHASAHVEPPPSISAKEAAAGFTFHKDEKKSKTPLMAGAAVLLLLLAGGGYMFMKGGFGPAAPPPTQATQPPATLSAEAQAAIARVNELEEKLKKLEEEKAAAAAEAENKAKKRIEDAAKARGETVDPAAVAKAQEEARKKAQAEQEKKAQEERRRLEDEKKAEEARIAEEQRKAEEVRLAAAAAAATTLPPTTIPAVQPVTTAPAPALRAGALVNLSDPGVVAPVLERKPALQYPPIAQRQRVEGTVELNVLVDEKGNVGDAQVVSAAGGKAGLNEAAIDYVKKLRYRAAVKDGIAVKVWIPVKVKFELPR